eukprot:TRINITY_DN18384_c0_g2_i1.p1 TRINITY_DN18384_c0_g2~~TRINITY_DN18384_c0_g2_i1.p1  ORF type:complete len:746 (+),score=236.20 TRINITY_DN18384_c0_g2_i1:109-2346(+)
MANLGVASFKPYGADREIEEARVKPSRPLLRIHYTRAREFFVGRRHDLKLSTTDAMEHGQEVRPFKDPTYERTGLREEGAHGMEHDIAVHAVRATCDARCQTPWFRKVHTAVQVTPVVIDARPKALYEPEKGPAINAFLRKVMPKVDHACVVNLTLPLFQDDYVELADDDTFLGNKDDAAFTDLGNFQHHRYTKKKRVTSIDWHPKNKNVVAVSVGEAVGPDNQPFTYTDRIMRDRKALNGLVVLWDFQDPIHPACVLESPQEINIVRFNPTNPDLIVGGAVNGQVVLWNISSVSGALSKKGRKGQRDKDKQGDKSTEGQADGSKARVPWGELSKIESGHKRAVNDLVWVASHHEVNTDAKFVPACQPHSEAHKAKRSWGGTETTPFCFEGARQFVTLSSDGFMFVWDLNKEHMRRDRFRKIVAQKKDSEIPWIPLCKILLSRPDGSGDLIGLRFSLEDRSQDPYLCAVGTEEGEFVHVNWAPLDAAAPGKAGFSGGDDAGRTQAVKLVAGFHADGRRVGHHGAVVSVQRHPVLHDYYLTAGDWSFRIWKLGCPHPVVSSPYIETMVTAGSWSPSRPGVIFVGTADGNIQVWDLLDRSHEPIVTQAVSQDPVSAMEFKPAAQDGKRGRDASERTEALAVGVRSGFLHVFKLPKVLVKPKTNERQEMERYLEREVVRGKYYQQRWEKRRKEIDEINAARQQISQDKSLKTDKQDEDEADNPFADPTQVELHLEEFKAKLRQLEDEE